MTERQNHGFLFAVDPLQANVGEASGRANHRFTGRLRA